MSSVTAVSSFVCYKFSFHEIFFLVGLRYISRSDAVLIINGAITVITAFVASRLNQDERLDKYRIIRVTLAILGVFLIFLFSPNKSVENRFLGNFLIMMAALAFGIYTVFSRPIYKEISLLNCKFGPLYSLDDTCRLEYCEASIC